MRKAWSFAFLWLSLFVLFAGCGGGGTGGGTGGGNGLPDATAPTVSSTSPASGATDVAVNTAVSATFSEAMDASTINATTFTVKAGSIAVPGTVSYIGTTATFTPTGNLANSTLYTATVTTGAKDLAGNALATSYVWNFNTGTSLDTTPPAVTSTSPASGATGVGINAAISVIFSEAMDASTVTATTFTVKAGSTAVPGAVSYIGTTATFTPTGNLAYSTPYTATVTTGAKDLAGNALPNNYVWSFTTGLHLQMGGSIQGISLSLMGAVSTPAGRSPIGFQDGTGSTASFYFPQDITTDGTNLYVADHFNYTIRKVVIATGVVTTLAGTAGSSGSTDGTGSAARFAYPQGITTDGTSLYVADSNTIRKVVIATGVVTTLAGTAGTSGSVDGTGSAARFNMPSGITTDGTNLYVADTENSTIRKVVIATGVVTTLAGTTPGAADGTGSAARFYRPSDITTDGTSLYVAESGNSTIRKVVIATGVVTTLAGTAGSSGSADGTGSAARFNSPSGITTDGTSLYVADSGNNTIRKVVIATGVVTTLAGTAGSSGSVDGTGSAAGFSGPSGITTDGTSLYVADSQNATIRKVVIATGVVTTIAGTAGSPGTADGTGSTARFFYASGITTDGTNLYVADTYVHTIRKVVIATGVVTTMAGSPTSGSADGTGSAARFNEPRGITTDGTSLYVTDTNNSTIREVE